MKLMIDGTPREQIERYFEGIQFPVLKHDAVLAIREAGAPPGVVSAVENLPYTRFLSCEHLLNAYGEMD